MFLALFYGVYISLLIHYAIVCYLILCFDNSRIWGEASASKINLSLTPMVGLTAVCSKTVVLSLLLGHCSLLLPLFVVVCVGPC